MKRDTRDFTVIMVVFILAAATAYAGVVFFPVGFQNPPTSDPDRIAVRKWLAENLNSPTWTEVRWWPVVRGPKCSISGIPVCRIKVRYNGPFGPVLDDLHLYVDKDGVRPMPDWHHEWWRQRRSYPFSD